MLTHARLLELLEYDTDTGIFLWKVSRGGKLKGSFAGRINSRGYATIRIDSTDYYAHRLAWMYVYGMLPEQEIDHIDRDTLNNSIHNLRDVSRLQNARNKGTHNNNTSGYKGVSLYTRLGKYRAQISIKGKNKDLGLFNTPEEASFAYQEAVKLHYIINK
jgi:HNH endonuclease